MPSLEGPWSCILSELCVLMKKELDEKVTLSGLSLQSCETDIIFLVMEGTTRILLRVRFRKDIESMWEILRPIPSQTNSSSVPSYRAWSERLLRSSVTWWDAPLSSIQENDELKFPKVAECANSLEIVGFRLMDKKGCLVWLHLECELQMRQRPLLLWQCLEGFFFYYLFIYFWGSNNWYHIRD